MDGCMYDDVLAHSSVLLDPSFPFPREWGLEADIMEEADKFEVLFNKTVRESAYFGFAVIGVVAVVAAAICTFFCIELG